MQEQEGNKDIKHAQQIAVNPARVMGSLNIVGGNDWYQMSVDAGATLTATLVPSSAVGLKLEILDSKQNVLATVQKGPGLIDSLHAANPAQATATMYVHVSYATGTTPSPYALNLTH